MLKKNNYQEGKFSTWNETNFGPETISFFHYLNSQPWLRFLQQISGIKEKLFGTFGTDDDLSLFNYGFNTDVNGTLSVNSSDFSAAVAANFDDLKGHNILKLKKNKIFEDVLIVHISY